jgi:hypothetical protein
VQGRGKGYISERTFASVLYSGARFFVSSLYIFRYIRKMVSTASDNSISDNQWGIKYSGFLLTFAQGTRASTNKERIP